jgi:hypothetical protein
MEDDGRSLRREHLDDSSLYRTPEGSGFEIPRSRLERESYLPNRRSPLKEEEKMSLAQEFITKHMWTNALDAGVYATGSSYPTTGVQNPWRDSQTLNLFLRVSANTGGVTLTPTIQERIDAGAYQTFKVLDSFVPDAGLNSAYFFKFEWEKMGLSEDHNGFRISFGLAGGTSLTMHGIWLHEVLRRFPRIYYHLGVGFNALGDDSNGNPKIIRVDEVV